MVPCLTLLPSISMRILPGVFLVPLLSLSNTLTAVFLLFAAKNLWLWFYYVSRKETFSSLFRGGAGFSCTLPVVPFALAFKDFATKYIFLHWYWAPEAAISTTTACAVWYGISYITMF
jgi:hypothetical protein